MAEEIYDTVLFVARECFVYRLPKRTTAAGYKAAEWGDMEAFLWKGRLRIIERGNECEIRMEDASTGESIVFRLQPGLNQIRRSGGEFGQRVTRFHFVQGRLEQFHPLGYRCHCQLFPML